MLRIYISLAAYPRFLRRSLLACFFLLLAPGVGGSVYAQDQGGGNDVTVNFPDQMTVNGSVDINYNPDTMTVQDYNGWGQAQGVNSTKTRDEGELQSSDLTYLTWSGDTFSNSSNNTSGNLGAFTYDLSSLFVASGSNAFSGQSVDLTFTIQPNVSIPSFNFSKVKDDFFLAVFGNANVQSSDFLFGLRQASQGIRQNYSYSVSVPFSTDTWTFNIPFIDFQRNFPAFFQFIQWLCQFCYWSTLLYAIVKTVMYFP